MCPKRNILFQGLERKVEWRGLLLCAVSPTSPTEKQCTGPIPCSLQSSSDESSPSPKVGQGISSSDKKKLIDPSGRSKLPLRSIMANPGHLAHVSVGEHPTCQPQQNGMNQNSQPPNFGAKQQWFLGLRTPKWVPSTFWFRVYIVSRMHQIDRTTPQSKGALISSSLCEKGHLLTKGDGAKLTV